MKVSQIIEILQTHYSPDDVVVMAWWNKDMFSQANGMSADDWEAASDDMENMDWSRTHDELSSVLDYWIDLGEGESTSLRGETK